LISTLVKQVVINMFNL